jgi:hypothetical protein
MISFLPDTGTKKRCQSSQALEAGNDRYSSATASKNSNMLAAYESALPRLRYTGPR